jgi:hypothetical protein
LTLIDWASDMVAGIQVVRFLIVFEVEIDRKMDWRILNRPANF